MKKLFNLLLLCTFCLAIFSSCSKDDEASLDEKETTYTFFYSAIDIPDGFDLDITLFEYNENNERVSQKNINSVHQGYSEKYVADKNATKVKVYMEMSKDGFSVYDWVQQVYYLEIGGNINIDITNDIRVGKKEP